MRSEDFSRELLYLPEPFPDETLHSIFSRYHRLSCNGDYRSSLQELSGRRSFNSFQDIPTCLSGLSKRASDSSSFTVERLLQGHTTFPYLQRFLLPAQINILKQRLSGETQRRGGGNGLGFAHMRGQSLPRFCPKCLDDDYSNFGQPYWHRVHQLPGVWSCPWHCHVLKYIDSVWLAKDPRRLFLPDDSEILGAVKSLFIDHDNDLMVKISISSSLLLFSEEFLFDLPNARKAARQACCSVGLMSNDRLNIEKITNYFSRVLQTLPSTGEFHFLACPKGKLLPSWVLEALRTPYRYRPPLEYLILWEGLGLNLASAGIAIGCDVISENDAGSVNSAVGRCSRREKKTVCYTETVRRRDAFISDGCECASRRAFYKWLRKNDREWLDAHKQSPGRGRKRGYSVEEWGRRDMDMSAAIKKVVERINSRSGPPVRITIGLILRELGISRHLLSYIDRMPLSRSLFLSVQESRNEFIYKRAVWAYRSVMEDKGYCDQSIVLRYANIKRPENWLELFGKIRGDLLEVV